MNLIVADVGGTNARLAFQKNINSEICLIENFLCTNFKSLEDIITLYKKKHNKYTAQKRFDIVLISNKSNVLVSITKMREFSVNIAWNKIINLTITT